MGRLSILPERFSSLETGIVWFFLLFASMIIGPWLCFILYDIVLYLWRVTTYELPYVGGRARGKARLRAQSLRDRNGEPRRVIRRMQHQDDLHQFSNGASKPTGTVGNEATSTGWDGEANGTSQRTFEKLKEKTVDDS